VNRFVISCIVLLVFVSPARAQDLPTARPEEVGFSTERLARLDEKFNAYVTDNKMAGSVILVARKGKVVYNKAFGFRDKEAGAKMETSSIFRIASQTKAIVSAAIMMLQEEGKLLIEDPVSRFLPEYESTTVAVRREGGGYDIVPAKRKMTIRELLTHTAGVGYGEGVAADLWKKAGLQGWYFAHRDEPVAETIKKIAALPMDAHPGEAYVYGYATDILGVIVEKASGISLDQFLKTRIFEPLGMTDTHFFLPPEKAKRLTTVYMPVEGKPLKPAPLQGTMDSQGQYVEGPRKNFSGGAGLVSTAKDYYLFLKMIAEGGELNGKRLLSPSTVDLMVANHLHKDIEYDAGVGFGLGFEVVLDLGQRGQPGSVGAFRWGGAYGSTYWVDPAEELIIVYFTQVRPSSIVPDQSMLRVLVYQALVK
jgi:CubicO group peptidase (beta-lactamase class C family)